MIVEQTEEIRILQDSIREFGENEIAPHVMEWDEAQEFPLEIVPKLADLGILGAIVPAEYGGAGLSYPEYIAAMEEISRIDGSIGLFLAAHNSLCCGHILLAGTEDQKRRYLPDLTRGAKIGAWALTEPGSGSDASAARTTAVRIGDEYAVNGTKHFITNATNADIFVLMASTDRDAGRNGLSAFILDRATPGLTIGRKENKLGLRASDTAGLVLEDCRIPAENLLGEEGGGFADCLRVLDGGRISIAAMAVGMAQGAFDHALKYATERQQFGKPIAEFQAIQFKLADMATEIEAARLLTYRAAELKQSGAKTTKESSMAKLFSGEVAVRVAGEAVQIHGGYGFIKDFPVEKYYRDVKLCTIGEGTSEIQRTVIARQLLRK
jgi:alkylation response protein AidB-like acyl-CoA dehydrogenase